MALYRNKDELLSAWDEMKNDFDRRWKEKNITASIDEYQDIASTMERPDFWDQPDKARELSMKKSQLEQRVAPWKKLRQELIDFPALVELTFEDASDAKLAADELTQEILRIQDEYDDALMQEALRDPDDARNAIINIASGAGGTESQDWADMLYRMYGRWFSNEGYRTEIVDYQPGEEAGIKNVTLIVRGENVFGRLKSENGIHRLVRISPFDSNKRRHTSFASVHITPEVDDDIDIDIDEKDIRVDTYRSSGAGGQHVNKTDSAIRITHAPTGIVVQCQNERSQMKNRSTAMKMLKARLYTLEQEKMRADIESRSGEKREVSWGNQIRSYVFHPYKMVKDLRTDHQTSDVDSVMDGDLNPFVNSYLKSLVTGTIKSPSANDSED